MVLIFSKYFDPSTNDVIDWLKHFKRPFIRVNYEDIDQFFKTLKLSSDQHKEAVELTFQHGDREVKYSDISAYWYRRGGLPHKTAERSFFQKIFGDETIAGKARQHLYAETKSLYLYLHYLLNKKKVRISSFNTATVCKLTVLHLAAKMGLEIPQTCISVTKNDIQDFKEKYGRAITKTILDGAHLANKERIYFNYTEELNDEVLAEMPEQFYPSLVQQKLDKKYELRVFYFFGRCYSMAIFSQSDQQTAVDFRKYNQEIPNRNIPYQLPRDIEEKLHDLMQALRLNSGSIDLVVTQDNRYVFLEVNPVGQFGMVSEPCNYYLEREIAKYLNQHEPVQ